MKKLLFIVAFLLSLTLTQAAPDTIGNQQIGSKVTFGLTIEAGTPPFTYQWSKNGTPIVGATGSTYIIPTVAVTDAGTYTVVVSNFAGSTVSNNAVFTVTLVPPSNVVITVSNG